MSICLHVFRVCQFVMRSFLSAINRLVSTGFGALALSSLRGVTSSNGLSHDMLVFVEELQLCAEGDSFIIRECVASLVVGSWACQHPTTTIIEACWRSILDFSVF